MTAPSILDSSDPAHLPMAMCRTSGQMNRMQLGVLALWALVGGEVSPGLEAELRSVLAPELARQAAGTIRLRSLDIAGSAALVTLELPATASLDDPPAAAENAFETAVGWLELRHPNLASVDLLVAHPGAPARLPGARASSPTASSPPSPGGLALPFVRGADADYPYGRALFGYTVALSPGHGYIYFDSLGRYSTQRGNVKFDGCGSCRGIVEDFGTHALVVRHLVPLLEGAGAKVILVRERYESALGVEVDDGDPELTTTGAFRAGTSAGGRGADYLASFEPGATATWTFTAPESGPSGLSLWFVAGGNRPSDARVHVWTPGGSEMSYLLDQQTHGRRWVPVAPLDLEAGDAVRLQIELPADADGEQALIADAARLGAGTHSSGHAWWSMGASPYAEALGAPSSVADNGDVTVRPSYAEWMGADAYLSVHSNATGVSGSTASGTTTYRYSCRAVSDHSADPDPSVCDDPAGSDRLQALVHASLVDAIREGWDPEWLDRGTRVANFGEMRQLNQIPGALVETAFHDNLSPSASGLRTSDNQALHDPRWRRAAAYGLYRGLSRFLAGNDVALHPSPPDTLVARRLGAGRVELSFRAAEGAQAHRVEIASGERSFVPGPIVGSSPIVLEDLPVGPVLGLRLRPLSAAGEGLPSRAVAVRASEAPSQTLIVDAFQREDAWVQGEDNRGDTALTHALALDATEHGFDGADEAALAAGALDETRYDALVVALGRESSEHGILTPGLRARLRSFVSAGGQLFMGGTEIGWVLDARGDAESQAFLAEVMGARLAADDTAETEVLALAAPFVETLGATPATLSVPGEAGRVEVRFADVFAPEPGWTAALAYGAGAGAEVAGVLGPQTFLLGFGIEHLRQPSDQAAILGGWLLSVLGPARPEAVDAGVAPPDSGPPDRGVVDLGLPDPGPADAGIALVPASLENDSEGCGCRSTPPPRGELAALVSSWIVWALVRRRKRRSNAPVLHRRIPFGFMQI